MIILMDSTVFAPAALFAYAGGFADCHRAGGYCPEFKVIAEGMAMVCCSPGMVADPTVLQQHLETLAGDSAECDAVARLAEFASAAFPNYAAYRLLGIKPATTKSLTVTRTRTRTATRTATATEHALTPRSIKSSFASFRKHMSDEGKAALTDAEKLVTPGIANVFAQKIDAHAMMAYVHAIGLCSTYGTFCPMLRILIDGIARYCAHEELTNADRTVLSQFIVGLMQQQQGGGIGKVLGITCGVLITAGLLAGVVAGIVIAATATGGLALIPVAGAVLLIISAIASIPEFTSSPDANPVPGQSSSRSRSRSRSRSNTAARTNVARTNVVARSNPKSNNTKSNAK
jgi:hypothetical protein